MKRIPFKHWLSFLNDGIWRITEDEVSAKQKRTYNILKISFLAVQQFTEDKICLLYTSPSPRDRG